MKSTVRLLRAAVIGMIALAFPGCARDTTVRTDLATVERVHPAYTTVHQSPDRIIVDRSPARISVNAANAPQVTIERPGVVVEQHPGEIVEERVTTTRNVETVEALDEDQPRGVLSTTVHFIGEIVALPFRLVGALLRAIF